MDVQPKTISDKRIIRNKFAFCFSCALPMIFSDEYDSKFIIARFYLFVCFCIVHGLCLVVLMFGFHCLYNLMISFINCKAKADRYPLIPSLVTIL